MLNKFKNWLNSRKSKKNVILIALDGVRLDQFREFTYFKQLSSKGTLFSNMITYSPHSITSFHAIFTGLYGNHSGVNSYFGTLNFKKEECKTLTQYLKEKGYYCLGDSMNELVIPKQGFDKLVIQEEFTEFIDNHKQLLNETADKNKEGKPVFLHLHCSYLHNKVVQGIIKPFKGKEIEYHQKPLENEKRYQTYLEEINQYLQKIILEIEKNKLWENSLIIFFSDHGNSLGEKIGEVAYGNFCYDYSLKTFALFINGGYPVTEIKQMVRNVDLTPTILDILSINSDSSKLPFNGESFQNLILNKKIEPRVAFSQTGGMTGPYPSPKSPNVHSIRTDKWKLIYYQVPDNFELFDLEEDPLEKKNLFDQGLMQVEKKMRSLLAEQIEH